MGVWGKAPRSQIYTDSLQLSNAFLRRFVAESILHLPLLPPKNSSDLCESHDSTVNRAGRAGWARAHPWLRYATAWRCKKHGCDGILNIYLIQVYTVLQVCVCLSFWLVLNYGIACMPKNC